MDELADHQKVHDLVRDIRFAMMSSSRSSCGALSRECLHRERLGRPQAGEHDTVEL